MKRTVASLSIGIIFVAAAIAPAKADSTSLGTSYSAAAKITPGDGLDPAVTQTGDLSGLLDFLTPVLDQVVQPLSDQLSSLSSSITTDLATALTGPTLTANSANTAQSAPASGLPDCSTTGWTQGNCYGPLIPNVDAQPLVTVHTGTVQGYAASDSNSAQAGASTANLQLALLGLSLGTLGVANSSASCITANACTAAASVTGVSLLGGALGVQTSSDGSLQVSVNGSAFAGLSAFPSPRTLAGAGLSATVQAHGSMLRLSVQLSLDQLLTGLGLADTLADLGASDTGSTVTLTLDLGAGTSTTGSHGTAWGLELGVGLSVDVKISVLGLVTVEVSAGNPLVTGNIADVELAYTAAANPDSATPAQAPPALT